MEEGTDVIKYKMSALDQNVFFTARKSRVSEFWQKIHIKTAIKN